MSGGRQHDRRRPCPWSRGFLGYPRDPQRPTGTNLARIDQLMATRLGDAARCRDDLRVAGSVAELRLGDVPQGVAILDRVVMSLCRHGRACRSRDIELPTGTDPMRTAQLATARLSPPIVKPRDLGITGPVTEVILRARKQI